MSLFDNDSILLLYSRFTIHRLHYTVNILVLYSKYTTLYSKYTLIYSKYTLLYSKYYTVNILILYSKYTNIQVSILLNSEYNQNRLTWLYERNSRATLT